MPPSPRKGAAFIWGARFGQHRRAVIAVQGGKMQVAQAQVLHVAEIRKGCAGPIRPIIFTAAGIGALQPIQNGGVMLRQAGAPHAAGGGVMQPVYDNIPDGVAGVCVEPDAVEGRGTHHIVSKPGVGRAHGFIVHGGDAAEPQPLHPPDGGHRGQLTGGTQALRLKAVVQNGKNRAADVVHNNV